MKRILIISDLFYPSNCIGALRPSKISKKLCNKGYHVDVFTRYEFKNTQSTEKICDEIYGIEKFVNSPSSNRSNKKHGNLYKKLWTIYNDINKFKKAFLFLKHFKQNVYINERLKNCEYDVVISSYGPLTSLFCGMYCKTKYPNVRWICDFRDPVVVKFINPFFRPLFRAIEKRACKLSDAIVAVSNGYLKRITKGKYSDKSHMIPNGYDINDMTFLQNVSFGDKQMCITYVGAMYDGSRDMSALFSVASELIKENAVDEKKIVIKYAGNEYYVFQSQAQKYNVENILCDCGQLSREDCLKLQFSSDMLLLSTWNDKSEYGVFPGKFLEYMLIGKPIISITNGKLADGEVSTVIREGNFGVAYESACHEKDYTNLKEYIKLCYEQWDNDKLICFSPNQIVLNRYNYDTVINKFEDLINEK